MLDPISSIFRAPDSDGQGGPAAAVEEAKPAEPAKAEESRTSSPETSRLPQTQEELDRIISERLTRAQRAERKAIEKEVKDGLEAERRREEAHKQGNYQKLYEESRQQLEALQRELEQANRLQIMSRIAAKYNLPTRLVDRLRGDSEEEIEADAKDLAKELKPHERRARDANSEAGKAGGDVSHDQSKPGGKRKEGPGDEARRYAFQTEKDVKW